MSLDIYLQKSSATPRLGDDSQIVAQLNDDGYYWFLWPFFEDLRRVTGQNIDLYGDAAFSGDNLSELKSVIEKARQLIESQLRTWDVCIGTQTFPNQKNIYSTVEKRQFDSLLNNLQTAIGKAQERNWRITFWGD